MNALLHTRLSSGQDTIDAKQVNQVVMAIDMAYQAKVIRETTLSRLFMYASSTDEKLELIN